MRECKCDTPSERVNPRFKGTCVKCKGLLSPAWTTNDKTFRKFFGRLKDCAPKDPAIDALITDCERREKAGRKTFGHSFLARDNIAEGCEEAADLALYSFLDTLKARREGRSAHEEMALTAAYHAAKAHEALRILRAKQRGAP